MRAACLLVLASLGCSGVDGPAAGGGTQKTETAPACAEATAPPTTRVRRLSKVELRTAVASLIDDGASQALDNLDADAQINGRYSNSDQQVASTSFLGAMNLSADVIGQNFKVTVTRATYDSACFASEGAAQSCAQAFIRSFGKRAFRRTIDDDDVTSLMVVYKAGCEVGIDDDMADRFANGLSYVVRAMLQAPDFLYLAELGDPSAESGSTTRMLTDEIASALSFSVVGMAPDDELANAAAQDRLGTPRVRAEQAARLIAAHPNGWMRQMRQFVSEWLGINFNKPDWAKDPGAVPAFSDALKDALQTETDMLIDDWATEPSGAGLDLLLTGSSTFVNEINAPVYGLSVTGGGFQKVSLDATERAGILTLGGFLGSTSHVGETSPVIRGKVIMQRLLCREPPPPPANVPPLPPRDPVAPTTTRARYAAHLADGACRGCHELFEPMGNAFEGYDALGAYRTEQNGVPVDTSGALVASDGAQTPVTGAVELVNLLAEDPDVLVCVTRQLFRFTVGRNEVAYDDCALEEATRSLTASGDLRDVVSSIVSSDAFVTRQVNQ